jgi:hypothetical protein
MYLVSVSAEYITLSLMESGRLPFQSSFLTLFDLFLPNVCDERANLCESRRESQLGHVLIAGL